MEHVQQRRLSQVLAESLRRASALQGEDADGLGALIQRYFLEGRLRLVCRWKAVRSNGTAFLHRRA
jgi:hypothetical protein